MSCTKAIFLILNVILWLTGAIFLGIGVWFWVDTSFSNYIVAFIQELDGFDQTFSVRTVAILFVVIGIAIFIVGFIGCCGAFWEIKWLLGMFIFMLTVVLLIELAAAILAAVYRNELLERVEGEGQAYIKERYMNKDMESKDADVAFNYIQYKWDCCGIMGPNDYKDSVYSKVPQSGNPLVPEYCCKMDPGYVFSQSTKVKNFASCNFEATNCFRDKCQEPALDLHIQGCADSIIKWVKEHLPILMGVGLGIFFLQLGVLITAICVCRNLGKPSRGRMMERGASEMKEEGTSDYEVHE